MIKTLGKQKALIIACTLALGACATGGAPSGTPSGYVLDSRNAIVKDPFNLCWRTGYWTPATANCECDRNILPKERCDPPKPAPAAAPPAPAPAPAAPPPAKPAPAPLAPPAPPPPPPPKPVTEKVTLAADVLFDFDKATLKPEGKAKLDDLVSKVKAVALEVIIAIGHTDSVGSDAYNQRLSVRRADAVKNYLVSQGVEPNRIYTEGKGEKQPIADNRTTEGRAKNRRVELEVVGTRTVTR